FLNKGVDRPNRIALIDPVLQALGKQRRLLAIDPLNEASHLIPPQIAAESYSANQIIQCVFTQLGSKADFAPCSDFVRFTPRKRTFDSRCGIARRRKKHRYSMTSSARDQFAAGAVAKARSRDITVGTPRMRSISSSGSFGSRSARQATWRSGRTRMSFFA